MVISSHIACLLIITSNTSVFMIHVAPYDIILSFPTLAIENAKLRVSMKNAVVRKRYEGGNQNQTSSPGWGDDPRNHRQGHRAAPDSVKHNWCPIIVTVGTHPKAYLKWCIYGGGGLLYQYQYKYETLKHIWGRQPI